MDVARLVDEEEHTPSTVPRVLPSLVDIVSPDPGIGADLEGQPVTAVFHWAVKWECRDQFEQWIERFSRMMWETYPVGFQVLTHVLPVHSAPRRTASPGRPCHPSPVPQGNTVIRPSACSGEYVHIIQYASYEALRPFLESPEHAAMLRALMPLIEGDAPQRAGISQADRIISDPLSDLLADRFRAPRPPPVWKIAVLTWMGLNIALALVAQCLGVHLDRVQVPTSIPAANNVHSPPPPVMYYNGRAP